MATPTDAAGRPVPYHFQDDGTTQEKLEGRNNAAYATLKDDLGNVVDTTNRLPVNSVLSGSTVPDTERLPIKPVGRAATIANALAFTTTTLQERKLTVHGGLTAAEVRSYRNFRIVIYDTHDQIPELSLYGGYISSVSSHATGTLLYKINPAPYASGTMSIQAKAGGTGASSAVVAVPALENLVTTDLVLRIQYPTAPTTGAITVVVEVG